MSAWPDTCVNHIPLPRYDPYSHYHSHYPRHVSCVAIIEPARLLIEQTEQKREEIDLIKIVEETDVEKLNKKAVYLLSFIGKAEHYDAVEMIYNDTASFRQVYACKELIMGTDVAFLATMGPCTYGRDFPETAESGVVKHDSVLLVLTNAIIDLYVAMYPALVTESPYNWEKFCFHIFRFVNWSSSSSSSSSSITTAPFDLEKSSYWKHADTMRDMCNVLKGRGETVRIRTWPQPDWECRLRHTRKLLLKCELKNVGSDFLLSAIEFRIFEFDVQHMIDMIRTV